MNFLFFILFYFFGNGSCEIIFKIIKFSYKIG